ncbi:hypothetical protein CK203_041915 [Vitis vinifera]|uniref:Retrovirus-related Pol polyprotein from transposon 17.6 n=1 Tax=Vitis vinifera TaxID=29760 RepID=A0A438FY71_VITVI|nr:hypothetical protein CK203_041915 [Vitis vinifera]
MEEEAKPTRQPQRRLNPHMQEVVRAEVLKLFKRASFTPFRIALGKLNAVTRKDHFPLPFMDQVLERVSGHPFYCFLDGYSGYFQIEIDVEDQEKTTFTFFMDDITVYGTSFEDCLSHLEDVLKRCIEKDLVLNWEKCHFMDAKFEWDDKCQRSFELLKQFLTSAPIVRAPNWELPFEVMCDSSDYAIGAVLGQKEDGQTLMVFHCGIHGSFSFEVFANQQDAKARLNIAHDTHGLPINDDFPEESLMLVEEVPWFAHIANYLVTGEIPSEWSSQDKKNFFAKVHAYYWEEPFLFKYCADQIIRKCVPEQEKHGILSHCHGMHVEATLPLKRRQ